MKRTHCTSCRSSDLLQFLDLGNSPIADAYLDSPDGWTGQPTLPLQLAVCIRCWLVQLLEQVDATTLFGTGYSFYSSASPPLSTYHRVYAGQILHDFPNQVKRGVVEVGCNDGDLLRHFAGPTAGSGGPVVGVDPAVGPASVATDRGLDVVVAEFGQHLTAGRLSGLIGQVGVVLANHVLAHVADIGDVLAGIKTLLHPDGVAVVEVQYLQDLLVNNAYDLVYHEHRQFFSLGSLAVAAFRAGLKVVDAELTDRQGGSLRVVLQPLSSPAHRTPTRVSRIRESEGWLTAWCTYAGVQGRADRIRARLRSLVLAEVARGRKLALYGAPAKATTLLHWTGLDHGQVLWAVDTTVAKQGRYMPGLQIPIHAPEAAPEADVYLLGAWNYQRQIVRANPGKSWIVPIPAPFLL